MLYCTCLSSQIVILFPGGARSGVDGGGLAAPALLGTGQRTAVGSDSQYCVIQQLSTNELPLSSFQLDSIISVVQCEDDS